jgi:hypothetical protein
MTYLTVAGLVLLLLVALPGWLGSVRRRLFPGRPSRFGEDWEVSSRVRVRPRRR